MLIVAIVTLIMMIPGFLADLRDLQNSAPPGRPVEVEVTVVVVLGRSDIGLSGVRAPAATFSMGG